MVILIGSAAFAGLAVVTTDQHTERQAAKRQEMLCVRHGPTIREINIQNVSMMDILHLFCYKAGIKLKSFLTAIFRNTSS